MDTHPTKGNRQCVARRESPRGVNWVTVKKAGPLDRGWVRPIIPPYLDMSETVTMFTTGRIWRKLPEKRREKLWLHFRGSDECLGTSERSVGRGGSRNVSSLTCSHSLGGASRSVDGSR